MKTSYPRLRRGRMKDGRSSADAPKPKGDVIVLTGITRMDINPDRVISGALGQLSDVLVLGWDHRGEFYIASNHADGPDLLWLLEMARAELFSSAEALQSGDIS